ncbi:MAG TPA: polyphosphate kinase 2 family protein [Verrucomicrobiae bacterium]|nr:polyphosphate kinase 2 family protein [Verrucomicrobiae bacterium]
MKLDKRFRVPPHSKVRLADFDPEDTAGVSKGDRAHEKLETNIERMADLEYRLYAEGRRSLLIVLQGMDAAGKDGTVRHVMTGLNPQNCRVTSFKVPSAEEAAHDFLWRIHKAMPARGENGIFNRSQYEDVLVVRVHDLVPKSVWSERYDQINRFEKLMTENGVTILKFFLHISRKEQLARLDARIDDPTRNWKISEADFKERKLWDDYVKAYEAVLSKCSTSYAPWFIIPANKKWFRNLAVSQIIVETLEKMNPKFPKPTVDLKKLKGK